MERVRLILLTVLCMGVYATLSSDAQNIDELMERAKAYAGQKNFEKSNECYESLITAVKPYDENGKFTNMLKGFIGINYISMGVPYLKERKFDKAEPLFEKAMDYAANDPKVLPVALSWMGDLYSWKALDSKASDRLEESIEFSIIAENNYRKANKIEKLLKEQVVRAGVMYEALRIGESQELLLEVVEGCATDSSLSPVLVKALYQLGVIDMDMEDFQQAIANLERCYSLAESNDSTMAKLAALKLSQLYRYQIPDQEKSERWSERASKFND